MRLTIEDFSARACSALCRLTTSRTPVVHLTGGLGVVASILDRRSIFVIGVDAGKLTTVYSSYALDVDVALALLGTVAAGAVQLAVIVYVEVQKEVLVRNHLKELGVGVWQMWTKNVTVYSR